MGNLPQGFSSTPFPTSLSSDLNSSFPSTPLYSPLFLSLPFPSSPFIPLSVSPGSPFLQVQSLPTCLLSPLSFLCVWIYLCTSPHMPACMYVHTRTLVSVCMCIHAHVCGHFPDAFHLLWLLCLPLTTTFSSNLSGWKPEVPLSPRPGEDSVYSLAASARGKGAGEGELLQNRSIECQPCAEL